MICGRIRLEKLFLLFCGVMVCGCSSFERVTYLSPETTKYSLLSSGRGPKEIVQFNLQNNVTMNLIVIDEPGNRMIKLYFDLPEGETLKFSNSTFCIESCYDHAKTKTFMEFQKIRVNYVRDGVGEFKFLESSYLLQGSTQQIMTSFGKRQAIYRQFEIDIKLNKPLPDNFSLTCPSFVLSGQKNELENIFYIRKTGVFYRAQPW